MAWEEIPRGRGCGRHSPDWLITPCVTVRKTYLTLNGNFQQRFGVSKGDSAVVRWDAERRVIGLEIGPAQALPSGFMVHFSGGKWNFTTASIHCGGFCRRLEADWNKSFKAVQKPSNAIIEIALLPDNEVT